MLKSIKESDDSNSEINEEFEDFDSLNIFNIIDNQNLEFSINDYVSKLRKKLLIIQREKENKNIEEKKFDNNKNKLRIKHGEKTTTALNLCQIPFMKFEINPSETLEEIMYILNKKTKTLNEVIYLQHLLNLFDPKNFSILKNDSIDINEVLFDISICLNMKKYAKNEIIFNYGDVNDKLFFLLRGSVTLLEPVEKKGYMSMEQYIEYLNQLINIGEYELVRKIIDKNKLYKNNHAVMKIKNISEREIKKKSTEKIKIKEGINKLHNIASIEFNLNVEEKVKFYFPKEIVYSKEIISIEEYQKRTLPKYTKEIEAKKKKKFLFHYNKENDKDNSYVPIKEKNKHIFIYYSYSIKKELSPFNILGELSEDNEIMNKSGLTSQKQRIAEYSSTAICNEPSILLYINFNTFEKFVKQRQEAISTKNINSLLEIPFFKGINSSTFKEKYLQLFTLYNYKNGEFIFRQEEKMKNIYFIKSGEIELTMESSMNDINNILEKLKKNNINEMNQNDNIIKNKKKKKLALNNEDEEDFKIVNEFKNDKNVIKWRIMRINYKDAIGLNEILDENNKYYMNAKCTSYIGEIYSIDYTKFYEIINEEKNVKFSYENYCIKKEKTLFERLNSIKKIYLVDKYKIYKNKLKKSFSWKKDKEINYNNLSKKRNDIKLDLINEALGNSFSDKNIRINSDNRNDNKNNKIDLVLEKNALTLSSKEINKIKSAKASNRKTIINSEISNTKTDDGLKVRKYSGKIKINKNLNFFNDRNEQNNLLNKRFNSEGKEKVKKHKFKKNKSYFGLVRFKEFNNLIKTSRNDNKKNKKSNLEINPNFNKYLKEIKRYRLDSAKQPKINPFSRIFFPFQKENINLKSNNFKFFQCKNELEKFYFNTIEFLVLDKFIADKEYKNNKEKNDKNAKNKKQRSVKELKKNIKLMKSKNKFPNHLIRRLEAERKINYFPEKLMNFQNKKGIYFLG